MNIHGQFGHNWYKNWFWKKNIGFSSYLIWTHFAQFLTKTKERWGVWWVLFILNKNVKIVRKRSRIGHYFPYEIKQTHFFHVDIVIDCELINYYDVDVQTNYFFIHEAAILTIMDPNLITSFIFEVRLACSWPKNVA